MPGDLVQEGAVVAEDLFGTVVCLSDHALDGLVHQRGGLVGAVQVGLAVQVLVVDHSGGHEAQLLAHAVEADHVPGQAGGLLDVAVGTVGDGAEDDLLGGAAAHDALEPVLELLLGGQVLLLLRQVHGVAQGAGGVGDDGDLADGVAGLQQGGHQGVAHLVVGDDALLDGGEDGVFLLGAGDDHLVAHQQVLLVHGHAALADGPEGGLVDEVRQVRANGTGGLLGDLVQVHILRQTDPAGMDLQSLQTALEVGAVHDDPAVEAAGAEQGLVQNFGAVGGGQDHDALVGIEAVDLAQQGVQGLVIVADALVALVAHGVDLVDEDDAGGDLGGLLEHIPDAAGADAHEGLLEIGAGDVEEGDVGLAGHGLGKQSLTGARRAHQQRALGELRADVGVLVGVVEEIDDLLEGFLGLVLTGHIGEADAGLLLHVDLGLGLAEAAHGIAAHALGHEAEQENEGQDGQQRQQHSGDVVLALLLLDLDAHIGQLVGQGDQVQGARDPGVAGALFGGGLVGLLLGQVDDLVVVDLHLVQGSGGHFGAEIGPVLFHILNFGDGVEDTGDSQGDQQTYGQHEPAGGLGLGIFGLLARIVFVRIIAYRVHRFGTPPVLVSSV